MTNQVDSTTARESIDHAIDALEDFASGDGAEDEQVIQVIGLMQRFDFGRNGMVRFASLEQANRLRRLLPQLITQRVAGIIEHVETSEQARTLFYNTLPEFVANVGKLHHIRERQSLSGRGGFGRETLAQLREKNAALEAENAELRAKTEAEAETAEI